jgi:hypothetical protein
VLWILLETKGSSTKPSGDGSKARDRGSFRILWKRTSLFFIGISLMLAGMAFRFYAMSVLGRFFTYDVAVQAGQTVVEVCSAPR